MIRSFDVFDTALTRSYGAPEDLLWHLGEILAEAGLVKDAASFYQARQDAERMAWEEGAYRKGIRIAQIYTLLAGKMGWDDVARLRALAEEVRLETESAHPVPDIQAQLVAARARDEKVVFISDMYLSAAHLQATLSRLGLAEPGEAIFVSSDAEVTKRSGRLFDLVLKTLSIPASQLSHVGDHLLGDFKVPRRKGVRARLYLRARPNRYEGRLLQQVETSDWRLRSAAAASKLGRLARTADDPETDLRDLLGSTIAPFVAGYANWLLAQAAAKGIRKLFFMARDMQIVHEVAARLARARGSEIECIYIHASRVAWQAPAYSGAHPFELAWLDDHLPDTKMESVLRRLLSEADLEELKARGGDLSLEGNAGDRAHLIQLLQAAPVDALVREETGRRRKALLGYMERKGYVPDRSCALVDAGWRGTLQKCLARAYKMEDAPSQVTGFYIGTRHRAILEEGSELHSFLPNALVKKYGYSLAALLETLLTANHGTTLGYGPAPDHEPVVAASPPDAFLRQWTLVRECCVSFAERLPASAAFAADPEALSRALVHPFVALCTEPAPEDARLFNAWLFDAGRDVPKPKEIAAPLNSIELLKLVVYWARRTPLADTYLASPWLHGSIAASNRPARWLAGLLVPKH